MFQTFTQVFLESYGAYTPSTRKSLIDIGHQQHKDGQAISQSLGVTSKAQAAVDEDSLTLAWEAATQALNRYDSNNIGSLYVGSESHPYAVKSTAGVLARALGLRSDIMVADLEHACKAGTAGVQIVAGQIQAGLIAAGMAVGTDVAQARPGDVLEFSAGAGAAALVLGQQPSQVKLKASLSLSTDTPDFWRRAYQKYPQHAGRFTGEPGYFRHVISASNRFLEALKKKPQDFTYAVFHMPNGKFPHKAAQQLGFTQKQIQPGFIVSEIGNPYSASSLIGLVRILEAAKPGESVFMTSYGSGSGSDCFWWEVGHE